MSPADAIAFLVAHQPMPPDSELTDELAARYDEARRALLESPHPDGLRLLLGSFGEGSGFGIYQLVGDVIARYPESDVVAAVGEALRSEHHGVRSWATEIALDHPDPQLIEPMLDNLESDDVDVRIFAAQYIAQVDHLDAAQVERVRGVLRTSVDPEVRTELARFAAS